MGNRVKNVCAAAAIAYALMGAWSGFCLSQAIPAVNLAGATYFAATWPLWLKVSPVHPPIPRWGFSFDADHGSKS